MGMAASQVRFLSLQNRKNTIGLNLMTLSNRKSALSRDMNRVAAQYNAAMNEKNLKWSTDSGVTYNDLSYDLLMKPNELNASLPYIISDSKGRVVVDNSKIVIDGTKTDVSYRDLAKMISSYSGTDKNNQTTYDNLSNIKFVNGNPVSGNPSVEGYEYQIVSSVDQYDITQNSLRYDLMTKLNIISQEDRDEWLAATSAMAGNKFGEVYVNKDGNLSGLLQEYLKASPTPLTSTASPISIELTDADGNVENVSSDKFFGKCNPDGTFIAGTGSVYGNLAVAEYELQEYKNWCGELHEVSLTTTTSHLFTGLSGIQLTQTTQPVISDMDSFTSELTNIKGIYENAGVSVSSSLTNWTNIFNDPEAYIETTGFDGNSMTDLIDGFAGVIYNSLFKASDVGAGDTTDGWSLTNNINGDEKDVNDEQGGYVTVAGKTVKKDLAKAAADWALLQTTEFFKATCENTNYHSTYGNPLDKAISEGDNYNGITECKKNKKWWQSLLYAVGGAALGALSVLIPGVGTLVAVGIAATAGGIAGGTTAAVNPDTTWNKGETKYVFNMANFTKTFFTFYQMYIEAEGKIDNITLDNSSTRTVNDNTIGYDVSSSDYNNRTNLLTNDVTDTAQKLVGTDDDGNPVYETWYVTKKSDGSIDKYLQKQSTPTSKLYKLSDGTYIEQGTISYTYNADDGSTQSGTALSREVFVDEYGNNVDISRTDTSSTTTITRVGGVKGENQTYSQYEKIVLTVNDSGENYSYYSKVNDTNALAQPTKTLPNSSMSITTSDGQTLKVANSGFQFTDQISVYLTPKSEHLQTLNSRIAKAKEAIKNAEKERDDIFSEKEKRMMAYFDSIFKQISTKGWVYDEHINDTSRSQQQNNQYLEAMFENNMYYITEVETLDGKDYNYATKLAHNVSHVFQVLDTDAQNAALSKYESEKAEITSKEKQLDIRMNKLETEQDAISTEMQSLKKIIDDNVSNTFKIFS